MAKGRSRTRAATNLAWVRSTIQAHSKQHEVVRYWRSPAWGEMNINLDTILMAWLPFLDVDLTLTGYASLRRLSG